MLVKVRPQAQLWAVWWEVSADAMKEGDRYRAGTSNPAALTAFRLVALHPNSNSASSRLSRLLPSSFALPYVAS
jgi:hypothetical protein